MSRHNDYNTSYELEKMLAQSISKIRDNVTRQHSIRREIAKLRRGRKPVASVPDEVRQWFEDTDAMEDDEEGE